MLWPIVALVVGFIAGFGTAITLVILALGNMGPKS